MTNVSKSIRPLFDVQLHCDAPNDDTLSIALNYMDLQDLTMFGFGRCCNL